MKPLITNIQRFSLHDGPGIRTTVFFKGCSLHCPWCANPENINRKKELYYISEKCNAQCEYINKCQKGEYPNDCIYHAVGKWGKYYSEDELYKTLIKDKSYYGDDGGVTFSGGEPLLFLPEYYNYLCDMLHEEKISICIETALFVPECSVEWMVNRIEHVYVDVKILNATECKTYLGGDLNQYLKNLKYVYDHKKNLDVIYRIPLIHKYTDTEANFENIIALLQKLPPSRVELLQAHNLAKKKYERLGKAYDDFDSPNKKKVYKFADSIARIGIDVEIKEI